MTQLLSFDRPYIASDNVRRALAADRAAAHALANTVAADAMSDLGVLALADGDVQQAVARFQQALRLAPTTQAGFHNLLAALLSANQLRGANFDALRSHLLEQWGDLPWRDDYIPLLVQPRFLNLEFVSGKCNLKCRMCIGVNAASHPNRLSFIDVEDIAVMLTAAPTITGITLSSGDSDPLLHPQFANVLNVAAQHGVRVDLYTNGLPLSAQTARIIATGGVVSMINFSIDAATKESYARIRGGDFNKVLHNLRMLAEMRSEANAELPLISTSFVAMRDNVHELPDFVRMVHEHGASQVIVDDLSGWRDAGNGNEPATAAESCATSLVSAGAVARELGIRISFHEGLQCILDDAKRQAQGNAECQKEEGRSDVDSNNWGSPSQEVNENAGGIAAHLHDVVASSRRENNAPGEGIVPQPQRGRGTRSNGTGGNGTLSTSIRSSEDIDDDVDAGVTASKMRGGDNASSQQQRKSKLACCGWIDGVWVGRDGALHPCCMVRSPIDMGRIDDGPLLENDKYLSIKRELLAGKVFPSCATQRMCAYVQQQIAADIPFEYIDIAETEVQTAQTEQRSASDDSILALPVLT